MADEITITIASNGEVLDEVTLSLDLDAAIDVTVAEDE